MDKPAKQRLLSKVLAFVLARVVEASTLAALGLITTPQGVYYDARQYISLYFLYEVFGAFIVFQYITANIKVNTTIYMLLSGMAGMVHIYFISSIIDADLDRTDLTLFSCIIGALIVGALSYRLIYEKFCNILLPRESAGIPDTH